MVAGLIVSPLVGMAAGDVFGLVVALLILGYLVYALFRGERL
jgi:K+-transporting ATPase KdpF subunit